MVRGMENGPLTVSGMALPSTARLNLQHTELPDTKVGTLVTWANISGSAGLLHQLNLVVNSSSYEYQEGCVSALVDGGTAHPNPIWLSSGLEDYFLGAYFHSMPVMHLPFSGFMLNATEESGKFGPANALAAYRIHEKDPVVFSDSLLLRWIAESDNDQGDGGWCNFHWPETKMPSTPPHIGVNASTISVSTLAFIYTW